MDELPSTDVPPALLEPTDDDGTTPDELTPALEVVATEDDCPLEEDVPADELDGFPDELDSAADEDTPTLLDNPVTDELDVPPELDELVRSPSRHALASTSQ